MEQIVDVARRYLGNGIGRQPVTRPERRSLSRMLSEPVSTFVDPGHKGHRLFIANDHDTSRIYNVGPDIGVTE